MFFIFKRVAKLIKNLSESFLYLLQPVTRPFSESHEFRYTRTSNF